MAAAIFRLILERKLGESSPAWKVESAGTWALDGKPAAAGAQQAVLDMGIDISLHRSRLISDRLLRSFDLILTMESGQKEALRAEFGETARHVYMLSEMADMAHDIRDPIGGSKTDYRETADELEQLLSLGFYKIYRLAARQARNGINF
jgi:protein-tyrosine phosphatase